MRSRPAPEPPPEPTKPQLWIAPVGTGIDEDGWQPLGTVDGFDMGIDQITIDPAALEPQPAATWDELREYMERVQVERTRRAQLVIDALREYARHVAAPALQEAGREIARAFENLKQAGIVAADGKPARAPDRPAWQSRYGPAHQRRRRR